MASQVVMPKMSDTMEEGVVVKWLKREGDPVASGDILAEIETDKAVLELEATATGILRKVLAPEDSKVPVGQPIAVIGAAEEDISPLVGAQASPSRQLYVPEPSAAMPAPPLASPRQDATTRERVDASPLARRMAEEAGIDIVHVPGTGPGGRVIKHDIDTFLAARPTLTPSHPIRDAALSATTNTAAAHPRHAAQREGAGADYIDQDLTMMRKAIARRMALSKATVPHFYVTAEVDMAQAGALRLSLNAIVAEDARISFNDIVVKATANALRQFPGLNVSYIDEKIRQHRRIHLSIAVALDDGLITPVIRDCDRKSLGEIARESRELVARARARSLKPEEYTGGTFSISNLGMYDVDDAGAIINPPEAAILAVGTIKEQAVVVNGQVAVGQRMKITLSCDHRAVDGVTAAQFLQIVKRLLEHPLSLML